MRHGYTQLWRAHRRAQLSRVRRRALCALVAGAALASALAVMRPLLADYAQVRESTLRLHILANSDAPEDQAVKLAVRDAVLDAEAGLFGRARTKDEALAMAHSALRAVEHIANETLRAHGFAYKATARLENMYFAARDYGDFTLPAGRYDAVRIELGDAGGQNWFCVLFPPLCVPAAADADDAPAYTDAQQAAVTSPYRVKFAAAEAVEWVKETLLGADGAQEASSEADAAPEESEPALEGEGAAAPVSQAAQDAEADAEEAAPRRAPKRARDAANDDWDAPA